MMLNGILFNSEAWHNVSQNDLTLLEKVDEALLQGLLNAHAKIPLEAMFLETSSIPIRFIVSSRTLMYLHSILQRNQDEMIRKIYEVQKVDPSPGDFIELIAEDKDMLGVNMSDLEIGSMSKLKFKRIVKDKTRQAAFLYLQSLKQGHSKMDGIKYEKFEKAAYMNSPLFNSESVALLLALRTRTVRGIENDFRGMFPVIKCPLSCGEDDTLQHVLECSTIHSNHTTSDLTSSDIRYEDVFSSDIIKQKQATELYRQLLEVRENLLNSQPEALTGPVHRL